MVLRDEIGKFVRTEAYSSEILDFADGLEISLECFEIIIIIQIKLTPYLI